MYERTRSGLRATGKGTLLAQKTADLNKKYGN